MELVLESTENLPQDAVLSLKVGNIKRQAPVSKAGQVFRFPNPEGPDGGGAPAATTTLFAELFQPVSSSSQPLPSLSPTLGGPDHVTMDFGADCRVHFRRRSAPASAAAASLIPTPTPSPSPSPAPSPMPPATAAAPASQPARALRNQPSTASIPDLAAVTAAAARGGTTMSDISPSFLNPRSDPERDSRKLSFSTNVAREAVDLKKVACISSEKVQAAKAAATYLEEHGLVILFQDILHGLLVAKPPHPQTYIEDFLAQKWGKPRLSAIPMRGVSPLPTPSAVSRSSVTQDNLLGAMMMELRREPAEGELAGKPPPAAPPQAALSKQLPSPGASEGVAAAATAASVGAEGSEEEQVALQQEQQQQQQEAAASNKKKDERKVQLEEEEPDRPEKKKSLVGRCSQTLPTPSTTSTTAELLDASIRCSSAISLPHDDSHDAAKRVAASAVGAAVVAAASAGEQEGEEEERKEREADAGKDAEQQKKYEKEGEAQLQSESDLSTREGSRAKVAVEESVDGDPSPLPILTPTKMKQEMEILKERWSERLSTQSEVFRGSLPPKVDALLSTLLRTRVNMGVVLPYLPRDLRSAITKTDFDEECRAKFNTIDVVGRGRLKADELLTCLESLSAQIGVSINHKQSKRFLEVAQSEFEGIVKIEDFATLVQFVIVSGYLDTDEGKVILETAVKEEQMFESFVAGIVEDRERLVTLIPFLPTSFVDEITSEEFKASCNKRFQELDQDGNGTLDPVELIPIVRQLSQAHPMAIDEAKCLQFARLFSDDEGSLMPEEFLEFAQFLSAMNFISHTDEGKELQKEAGVETSCSKMHSQLELLEKEPRRLDEVLGSMPLGLAGQLKSGTFAEACKHVFEVADKAHAGVLSISTLLPGIVRTIKPLSFVKDSSMVHKWAEDWDVKSTGMVSSGDFLSLVQYISVRGFLYHRKDNVSRSLPAIGAILGQDKITMILTSLAQGVEKLTDIIPFLPQSLVDEVHSDEFCKDCSDQFHNLDRDRSGTLDAEELVPLISEVIGLRDSKLRPDHCKYFVDIFDLDHNGVISLGEFTSLVRFVIIMGYLESEEWNEVTQEVVNSQNAVEELLRMLEKDHRSVHKVVSLLPQRIFDELTSDAFVEDCHEKFKGLQVNSNGALSPAELHPVVAELSAAQLYTVSEDQCKRFTQIFDINDDGVLGPEEFLDFARFLRIMSYLNTDEGKNAAGEALAVMEQSKKLEELIEELTKDKAALKEVIPHLPDWLRQDLISQHFTLECLSYFDDLDTDGNGTLDPEELYPMVLSLSKVSEQALDLSQCRRLTEIWDDEKTGVITKDQFVFFSRFLIIMGYLKNEQEQIGEDASPRQTPSTIVKHHTHPALPEPGLIPSPPKHPKPDATRPASAPVLTMEVRKVPPGESGERGERINFSTVELAPPIPASRSTSNDTRGSGGGSGSASTHFHNPHQNGGALTANHSSNHRNNNSSNNNNNQNNNINQHHETGSAASLPPPSPPQSGPGSLTSNPSSSQNPMPPSVVAAHLEVDCKYYQQKSKKLSIENDMLRERLQTLERSFRKLEDQLGDCQQQLRHAELERRHR